MLSTLLPIVIEVKLVIPEQMDAGITSTSSPNVKEVTWFPKLKEGPFFAFHIIDVKFEQL